jgi:two-component system response regulator NreC
MSIRIILAEDHIVTREGLRLLLDKEPDLEVVGESGDGRQAVKQARALNPDIVIMDITLPNLNGIDATRQILNEFPHIKVIALSMHSTREYVADMLKAGATGYLLKDASSEEVIEAIHAVALGGTYLSSAVTDVVVTDYAKKLSAPAESTSPLETLTPREREVLQLVAEGKTNKEIAQELHRSVKAIESTRRRIMEKLGVNSIAELVKLAIAGGLTSLEL